MQRIIILAAIALTGCDERIVEETHQPEPARPVVQSVLEDGYAWARLRYSDGVECVSVNGKGIDCNWPAPEILASETPEARRLRFADCVNAIDPASHDLSKLILECGGVRHD